jgi:hypothetical protein
MNLRVSKKRFILLADAQRELIEPPLPEPKRQKDKHVASVDLETVRACEFDCRSYCLKIVVRCLRFAELTFAESEHDDNDTYGLSVSGAHSCLARWADTRSFIWARRRAY